MEQSARIVVTGGNGLVGTALKQVISEKGHTQLHAPSSREVDFTDWQATLGYFRQVRPEYVFHLAARVYGILGNMENKGLSYLDNTLINTHVIEACRQAGARKVVAMGSGCVYPYPSPGKILKEDMIWQGPPHQSEDSYAHSKRAMYAQLSAYREQWGFQSVFAISGNLFGPNDKFDDQHGHVTPSLVRKFFEAKRDGTRAVVWGDGSARRDFMYSLDAAEALYFMMLKGKGAMNLGSGQVHAIREIVDVLADITGLAGRIDWDASKPNGQDFRAYDHTHLAATGFKPRYTLREGVRLTYEWYAANVDKARH